MIEVRDLQPADLMAIDLQPTQRVTLGLDTRAVSIDEAEDLASSRFAWSVRHEGRLIACVGIAETFPGVQGVGWAHLAAGIGGAHLALTRFARERIATCGLARVEAIVRAPDAEAIIASFPFAADDAEALLHAVLQYPTPEMVWIRLLGLRPAHVLRKYGARAETHMLYERIG